MPSLADLYSAIGSAKRRAADTLANPGLSLAQMVGNANDRARVLNEQTAAAAQEGIDYGPASRQLANQMAEAYNPVGMTVFHGSPHIFEKFDLSKIGTGEGAQAYGKGMYMAQNPEVAMGYRGSTSNFGLTDKDPAKGIATLIASRGDQGEKMARQAYANLGDALEPTIQKAKNAVATNSSIYKVDLPDTHIRRMLDWDEPLKNQPKQVRDLAKRLGMDMNDLGGDLLAKVGKDEAGKQTLENAGIRGIKYLDQTSRDVNKNWVVNIKDHGGYDFPSLNEAKAFMKQNSQYQMDLIEPQKRTRNFVVFDPNHLTILERNNQPIK